MNVDDIRSFVKNIFCKKKNVFYKYSVVSACYNVEPYLNDFFKSIVNQSISFEDNIYLIMVDDGSTDLTYQVIQKWVSKYPRNITCVRKENGGQATARNEGLRFVKTPWVTFIDPDDFINDVFFENIDNFLKKSTNIDKFLLIATNIICYHENSKLYKDNHPLSYKFKKRRNNITYIKVRIKYSIICCQCCFQFEIY
jgi:glycosyltransferase involved in cell wall biosynthesis